MEEVELGWIVKRLKKMDFTFDELGIDESLMEDIKVRGIKAPLEFLAKVDGSVELLDGLHRLAIAVKLGFDRVPVIIKEVR